MSIYCVKVSCNVFSFLCVRFCKTFHRCTAMFSVAYNQKKYVSEMCILSLCRKAKVYVEYC